jgi:hypothetical protein
MYGKAQIKMSGGEMICTFLPAKHVFTSKMTYWNKNTYRVDFKDPFLPFGLIKFELNNAKKVIGFKIDLPSSDFHFKNLDFKKIN